MRSRARTAALLLIVAITAVAGSVPRSTAAFTAGIANSTNIVRAVNYATCAAAYAANGPAVYYPLDDTGGLALDATGNGRNGVYQGGVTRGVAGVCPRDGGTAVTLDGSTGYLDYGATLAVSATYSGELWFRTTTTRGGFLLGFGAAATGNSVTVDRVLYLSDAGTLVLGVNNTLKISVATSTRYNDGGWHHVLAAVGATQSHLYVDGVDVASANLAVSAVYTGYLRVGEDNLAGWPSAPTSNFFAGSVDEVAVYARTLTATDAANHYWAGV